MYNFCADFVNTVLLLHINYNDVNHMALNLLTIQYISSLFIKFIIQPDNSIYMYVVFVYLNS